MDNKKIIGKRINSALATANKKQKELAAALGVTDNTISYFVSGKRTPNTEQIIKIAAFLNVSADYLLGLSDVQSTDIDTQAICKKIGCSEKVVNRLIAIYSLVNSDELINDFFMYENWETFFTNLDQAVFSKNRYFSLKKEFQRAEFVYSLANKGFDIFGTDPFYSCDKNGIKKICYTRKPNREDCEAARSKLIETGTELENEINFADAVLWRSQSHFTALMDYLLKKHVKGEECESDELETINYFNEIKQEEEHANPNEQ